MKKEFADILEIARSVKHKNPHVLGKNAGEAAEQYLSGLVEEVNEVREEIKGNNEVHLIDELSDIAWDYVALLSVLEEHKLISSAEDVISHAHNKYSERTVGTAENFNDKWFEVKEGQKKELSKRHTEKYGQEI